MHVDARNLPDGFLNRSPPYLLRQGPSLKLRLTDLVGQGWPERPRDLVVSVLPRPGLPGTGSAFYMGAGAPSLEPRVYATSALFQLMHLLNPALFDSFTQTAKFQIHRFKEKPVKRKGPRGFQLQS